MQQGKIGFLFDMDGVIVDNHSYHMKAWTLFFEKHGLKISEQQFKDNINGRTIEAAISYLFGDGLSKGELYAFAEEKESLFRELYSPYIQATPGLYEFLDTIKKCRYPMAVATSAPVKNIELTLSKTKTLPYFETVVDSQEVTNGKPDPEIYQVAALKLTCSPERCIVFEDSISGIIAGKSAGAKVVGLATTHTKEELKETGCDLIISDFTQADLQDILSLI